MESLISIIGLFLACGLLGGLGTLIYGLIEGNSTGTLGGGVVLGVSAAFSMLLVLFIILCFKNNDVDSNTNERQSSTNVHQHKRKPHVKHRDTSVHEIEAVPEIHIYEQQEQKCRLEKNVLSSPALTDTLVDCTNTAYSKQISPPSSSSKSVFSIDYLNESNHSIDNRNHYSVTKSDRN
ncbi:unnamed protein product [Rotaria socialis]|nr:unnamed protein product [Rotaria socialis]CAF3327437.1 unnamed protein product [Rotaria socialis]CAF3515341.1 unnamed protein product [Rotaria socialis]CAF3697675.1 unnamed protein product [Rotaria socialis]CAF4195911.1 unnamed protein product [Rotaria socialis]